MAVEVFDDFAGGALDGFGLVAEEAGGADEVFEIGQRGLGHCWRGGEAAEEFGGDHVDAHISALRGEDGGDEEFPGRAVVKGADGVGVGFVEGLEDGGDAGGRERAAGGRRLRGNCSRLLSRGGGFRLRLIGDTFLLRLCSRHKLSTVALLIHVTRLVVRFAQ